MKNLSEQVVRGEELLETRARASSVDIDSGEPVEWVDAERDYLIDDDVDLVEDQVVWVPSCAWEERNMERLDDERLNVEMGETKDWEEYAAEQGGMFNKMDGRYHKHAGQLMEKAANDHWYRTENRRVCSYYFGKKGCKYEYNCTSRHHRTDEEWQFSKDLKKGKIQKRKYEYTEEEVQMYAHFGGASSSGGNKRRKFQ